MAIVNNSDEISDFDYINLLGEAYRVLIEERYNFDSMQIKLETPPYITRKTIDSIRIFFLNDLYPTLEERIQLITTFDSFRDHIHLDMLLRIAGQLIGSVLKFGLYLPLVMKIVYLFFKAYINLKKLETIAIKEGKDSNLYPPFSVEHLLICFRAIPKDKLLHITKEIISIVESFIYNIRFIETVEIVLKDIEKNMHQNTNLYTENDIQILKLGLRIVSNALILLKSFPNEEERKQIIQYILKYEILFIEEL